MLKFVFDTNVFVSALMSKRGNPALLLDRVRKSYTLFISKDILSELKDVISRDKFGYTEEVNTFVEAIMTFSGIGIMNLENQDKRNKNGTIYR